MKKTRKKRLVTRLWSDDPLFELWNVEVLAKFKMSLRLRGSFLGNQNQMSFIFVSVLVNKLEYTFERTNGKREVRTLIEPKISKNFKVRADDFFVLSTGFWMSALKKRR